MSAADLHENAEVVRWWDNESPLAEDGLSNHGGNVFGRDHPLERVLEMASAVKVAGRIFQRIRAAVTVGIGNAIDIAGKRGKSRFVRMCLAGESQRHHGAAVEGIFEGDDARASSVGARDF